jgi:outer membrane protein assembly factor BamE
MQKLLTTLLCGATLAMAGCSSPGPAGAAKTLGYRPDLQQGNVFDQDMVNKLHPGMTKAQVRNLMGTPMVTDSFHQDRWDYFYSLQASRGDYEERRMTLFFSEGVLVGIDGDLRPAPGESPLGPPKEQVIEVPDYRERKPGLF